MEWWNRVGAMYQFLTATPALAHDMAVNGPPTDFAYTLANNLAAGPTPLDVYPAGVVTGD